MAEELGGEVVEEFSPENTGSQAAVSHLAKRFSFLECEEMGIGQPRRCQTCSSCTKCSVRSVAMTRKEQEELSLIESNISVDLARKRVVFKYPFIRETREVGSPKYSRKQAAANPRGF